MPFSISVVRKLTTILTMKYDKAEGERPKNKSCKHGFCVEPNCNNPIVACGICKGTSAECLFDNCRAHCHQKW